MYIYLIPDTNCRFGIFHTVFSMFFYGGDAARYA